MTYHLPGLRLGIIGGGQLGRMMAIEARRLGIYTICLDPSPKPPAWGIADECLQGSLQDARSLQLLANKSDVMTFEIEHVNITALLELEAEGVRIQPRPGILEIIQDKLVQKQFLDQRGLAVPKYESLPLDYQGFYKPTRFPFVHKARSGGYDGRGVVVIQDASEQKNLLAVDGMVEEFIPVQKELAILLARSADGEVRVWDPIEMIFDPKAQICTNVAAPARVPAEITLTCRSLALKAVQALEGVGVFAVELFWAQDGRILINEIAPRPHNSGHWTIEGAETNQFEQHIRAVCGLPLGDPRTLEPSVMMNLLGEPGSSGFPRIQGSDLALSTPGLHIHWYQKDKVAPNRKMGHLTITRPSLEEALHLAQHLEGRITVGGDHGSQDR